MDYPSSISIEAFKRDLLRNFDLFPELIKIKIVSHTMKQAYRKAKKFVSIEMELKLDKKNKTTIEATPEKEKKKRR